MRVVGKNKRLTSVNMKKRTQSKRCNDYNALADWKDYKMKINKTKLTPAGPSCSAPFWFFLSAWSFFIWLSIISKINKIILSTCIFIYYIIGGGYSYIRKFKGVPVSRKKEIYSQACYVKTQKKKLYIQYVPFIKICHTNIICQAKQEYL